MEVTKVIFLYLKIIFKKYDFSLFLKRASFRLYPRNILETRIINLDHLEQD